jgi:hypothetical protein
MQNRWRWVHIATPTSKLHAPLVTESGAQQQADDLALRRGPHMIGAADIDPNARLMQSSSSLLPPRDVLRDHTEKKQHVTTPDAKPWINNNPVGNMVPGDGARIARRDM